MTRSRIPRICELPTPFPAAAEHVLCSAVVCSHELAGSRSRAFRGRFSKIHASCASRNADIHRAIRSSWGPESGSSTPIGPVSRRGYVTDRGCFEGRNRAGKPVTCSDTRSHASHMRAGDASRCAGSYEQDEQDELTKSLGHLLEITLEFRNARVRKPIGQLEFTGKGETA